MSLYAFRPFTRADLPMAARWLHAPEVARWWGDAERELAVVTEDLDEPLMQQWVVEYCGQPFGYSRVSGSAFTYDLADFKDRESSTVFDL